MDNKSNRTRLIGLIHFQKSALALSDVEYHAIVFGATGKKSCADCDMQELFKVFNDLNTLLEQMGRRKFYFTKNENKVKATLQDVVIIKAKKVFADNWYERLLGFLKKIGKDSLANCNDRTLRQILAWISKSERMTKNAE